MDAPTPSEFAATATTTIFDRALVTNVYRSVFAVERLVDGVQFESLSNNVNAGTGRLETMT